MGHVLSGPLDELIEALALDLVECGDIAGAGTLPIADPAVEIGRESGLPALKACGTASEILGEHREAFV